MALAGCAASPSSGDAPDQVPVTTGAPVQGHEGYYSAGRFTFGPQPDGATLDALAPGGAATVINLRSSGEMADLAAEENFDEAAHLRDAGVRYVHIPLGGDDGYAPEDVDAFAAAVESTDGPVLIHCLSGSRARTMWQAYLVRHRGYSLARAERVAATLGGTPTPLEQLLGRDVRSSVGAPLPPSTP
jgi:uncharacterized protein (TIGR01244 family)